MNLVYISGPMTGRPDFNRAEFSKAEAVLQSNGWTVVNPHKIDHTGHCGSWREYMNRDIQAMVDCDVLYVLKGWRWSSGARIERRLALGLGMPVLYEKTDLLVRLGRVIEKWRNP